MRFLIIIITILTFNTTSIAFDVSEWWGGVERICQTWGRYVPQNPPPAECDGDITGDEVRNLMPPLYPDHIWNAHYKTTSIEEIKRFVKWDQLNRQFEYATDYNDCDSFAIQLLARIKSWSPGLS